uniref:2-methoxy-6-polyprenyl-1,4-benzoquinol methylase, mitochondrial n=1 Tax=Aureoumbra lagunensis TaxID=44058 RepID=A0A7S3NNE3_9STRA
MTCRVLFSRKVLALETRKKSRENILDYIHRGRWTSSGSNPSLQETVHFGSRIVKKEEKAELVSEVFTSVASRYDIMNDLMSGGMHRLWKDDFVRKLGVATCARATGSIPRLLDVAGGTGDIAFRVIQQLINWLPSAVSAQSNPYIIVSDPNAAMLEVGRKKAKERHILPEIMKFEIGHAHELPYDDNTFDFVTISFGLRNCTDIFAALQEMRRVLKPGGRFECLEFSKVSDPLLNTIYRTYSKRVIPELGARVANDRDSYDYLVESIRRHPDQLQLLSQLSAAGFKSPSYRNLTFGVVAIHSGFK